MGDENYWWKKCVSCVNWVVSERWDGKNPCAHCSVCPYAACGSPYNYLSRYEDRSYKKVIIPEGD